MIQLADCLDPARIVCTVEVSSKKRAFQELSNLLAKGDENLAVNEILDSLLARERLGSTGIGYGMALPHGRLPDIDRVICAFMSLKKGVDFDSADGQSVDLLFALIVPEEAAEEHLQLLAELARIFSQDILRTRLRAAQTADAVYGFLLEAESAKFAQRASS